MEKYTPLTFITISNCLMTFGKKLLDAIIVESISNLDPTKEEYKAVTEQEVQKLLVEKEDKLPQTKHINNGTSIKIKVNMDDNVLLFTTIDRKADKTWIHLNYLQADKEDLDGSYKNNSRNNQNIINQDIQQQIGW